MPNVTWFSQDLRILHKLWGGPPGPRGSPWTRFSPTESASSAQGKPTRASAADQGVRPTINADCPILTKPSDIGHSACHRPRSSAFVAYAGGGGNASPTRNSLPGAASGLTHSRSLYTVTDWYNPFSDPDAPPAFAPRHRPPNTRQFRPGRTGLLPWSDRIPASNRISPPPGADHRAADSRFRIPTTVSSKPPDPAAAHWWGCLRERRRWGSPDLRTVRQKLESTKPGQQSGY